MKPDERKVPVPSDLATTGYQSVERIPVVEMQQLLDAGFNGFGLQLFVESIANKAYGQEFEPFSFIFRGLRITFQREPGMEIDTRHH